MHNVKCACLPLNNHLICLYILVCWCFCYIFIGLKLWNASYFVYREIGIERSITLTIYLSNNKLKHKNVICPIISNYIVVEFCNTSTAAIFCETEQIIWIMVIDGYMH